MGFIIATASVLAGFLLGYGVAVFTQAAILCEPDESVDEVA